ncbi:MAG: spore coat associated protein CotJA [Clostridia bacterium]|nr:spore coat associated protein CotJA [Clostridia bacterium]
MRKHSPAAHRPRTYPLTPCQTAYTAGVELPLARSYIAVQEYQDLYEPDRALKRGTMFARLDQPMQGCQ